MITSLGERVPRVDGSAWVASSAHVVGDVTIGAEASVWYGAVVRADAEAILIGAGGNLQDGCVLHADPGSPLVLGDGVVAGHRAVLHGCRIGDEVLVGIGAIVMNDAVVGAGSLIGAGALVGEGHGDPAAVAGARHAGSGAPGDHGRRGRADPAERRPLPRPAPGAHRRRPHPAPAHQRSVERGSVEAVDPLVVVGRRSGLEADTGEVAAVDSRGRGGDQPGDCRPGCVPMRRP